MPLPRLPAITLEAVLPPMVLLPERFRRTPLDEFPRVVDLLEFVPIQLPATSTWLDWSRSTPLDRLPEITFPLPAAPPTVTPPAMLSRRMPSEPLPSEICWPSMSWIVPLPSRSVPMLFPRMARLNAAFGEPATCEAWIPAARLAEMRLYAICVDEGPRRKMP